MSAYEAEVYPGVYDSKSRQIEGVNREFFPVITR
jgi:hypothetical protein